LFQAILDHTPEGFEEMELKVGDLVGLAGDHWNGYSKGRNLRTNANGLFPSYKIKDIVKAV
jgi:glycoprotein 6-alpha-L-fucosyltransferase